MNWVYFSSGRFGAGLLEALLSRQFHPKTVFTIPDRPSGRGGRLSPSPVKVLCLKDGLQFREVSSKDELREMRFDATVVCCDIGLIFPPEFVAANYCINTHPSLLPRWRGASPIFWAIYSGDKESGVTLFKMNEGLDTGDILLQEKVTIGDMMDYAELESLLIIKAADMLSSILKENMLSLETVPQKGQSSYAKKVSRDILRIDWNGSAVDAHNLIRAASPYLGAWSSFRGRRLKVFKARPVGSCEDGLGKIIEVTKETIKVCCNPGALEILEVQPEAKKRMSTRDFILGYRPQVGEELGL